MCDAIMCEHESWPDVDAQPIKRGSAVEILEKPLYWSSPDVKGRRGTVRGFDVGRSDYVSAGVEVGGIQTIIFVRVCDLRLINPLVLLAEIE